jgi:hypothetical protein
MGGGEGVFGRLQLLSQPGLSIIRILKGLFGNMTDSFFSAKDRLTANQAAFSLDNASCAVASYVVSNIVQIRSWNQQKVSKA